MQSEGLVWEHWGAPKLLWSAQANWKCELEESYKQATWEGDLAKASTVQTQCVSFLTPASDKGSQTSSQTQLVITNAPELCPHESKQPEIEGNTTDSDWAQSAWISITIVSKGRAEHSKKSGHGKIQATLSMQNIVSSQDKSKHALACGNQGESEACGLNSTMRSHRLFRMHEEVKQEINRLFTASQKKTLEVFLQEDPKTLIWEKYLETMTWDACWVVRTFLTQCWRLFNTLSSVPRTTCTLYLQHCFSTYKTLLEQEKHCLSSVISHEQRTYFGASTLTIGPGATVYCFNSLLHGNNLPNNLIIQCEKLTSCAVPPCTEQEGNSTLSTSTNGWWLWSLCQPHCP